MTQTATAITNRRQALRKVGTTTATPKRYRRAPLPRYGWRPLKQKVVYKRTAAANKRAVDEAILVGAGALIVLISALAV